MKGKYEETGNVILRSEEIDDLRKAILDKYTELTGEKIKNPDRYLNSNLKKYWPLYRSIDDFASLNSIGIKSTKPLAVVFHFSKNNSEGSTAFRKKFVDALYFYAFGCSRDEFIGQKKNFVGSAVELSQLNNLKGYWECYYDKDARFVETIKNKNEASLNVIAFTVKGDNIDNAKVEYYHSKDWGSGSIKIQGGNFILQLNGYKDNEIAFQIMNCGKNIEDFVNHIRFAVGVSLYVNDIGSVKAVKCLMVYFDSNKLMGKFNTPEIDLSDEDFRRKFQPELKVHSGSVDDKWQEKIQHFFEKGFNATDLHISDFAAID